jgi:hypothetical protein
LQILYEISLLSDEVREQLLVPVLKDIILSAINALPESESKKKVDLEFNLRIRNHIGGLIELGKRNNLLPEDFSEQRLLVQEYAKSKNIKISE